MISCHLLRHNFEKSSFKININELKLDQKGITGFIGTNGAGKSTLFSFIAGIMKPQNGFVRFNEFNTFKDFEKCKKEIHLLSWDISIYEEMTGREHLEFVKSITKRWDNDLETLLKEELMIPLEQQIEDLSRGEKAKLRLLLSLCAKPKLILIDEMINELDYETRRTMYQKLDDYSYENESQIFVATNIIEDMERYASQIVLMKDGEVILNKPLDILKEEQNLRLEDICKQELGGLL